jgi:protein phosphatase
MALILRYAVRSDLGLVRGNNEDSVYAGPRLLAIADGMGGHAAGEVASKIAIGAVEVLDEDRALGDLMGAMRRAVAEGNQRIAEAANRNTQLEGMGTTLTALRFAGSQVGLVHVGDSRAYLLRGDQLAQITRDDTYVQMLVDSGKITAEEAKDHPRKSVILRALTGQEVEPEVSIREARAGDRYLLCSDGLSDVVSPETILETMQIAEVQECADRLVELALRGGGPDNVTVIVAEVVDVRAGDLVDDVPVVAGALIDPSSADLPGSGSPAERAAQIARPHIHLRRDKPADAAKPSRLALRTTLLVVGILLLIVIALGGTYAWTQTQYFVGKDGSQVAIFKGVNAEFGPLKFFSVYENYSTLPIDQLDSSTRSTVESGITARNKADALAIIQRLQDSLCPTSTAPTTPPPSTPPSTTAAHSSRSTGTTGSAHPGRTTSPRPTPSSAAPPTATSTLNPTSGC